MDPAAQERTGVMNPLNRQWFYRGLRRRLVMALGRAQANTIWDDAGKEYQSMLSGNAALKKHKGAMVLPAVALYRALTASGADAEDLLNAYGDAMGRRFAGIVHCITSVPGVSGLIWRHVDSIIVS